MAITKYDLDINKQAIIKPVVILRQGDHDIDTMHVSLSVANEPMNLTGATVKFMGNTANGHKIIDDANVKIIDAKGGVFEYVFPSEASSDIGEYKVAYFSIILANGQSSTMDFRVQVLSGVDLSASAASDYVSHYDTMVSTLNSAYNSATSATNTKMAAAVSSVATSASTVLNSALARVATVNSQANNASSTANNAVSMASSVASAVTSQATYINSVASSAVANVNSAADVYVKKTGTETIAGNKTFTSPINGQLVTEPFNLLHNTEFENNLSEWNVVNNGGNATILVSTAGLPANGHQYVRISAGATALTDNAYVEQIVTGGITSAPYTLSFYGWASVSNASGAGAWIIEVNSAGSETVSNFIDFGNSTSWTKYYKTFTPDSTTRSLKIRFKLNRSKANVSVGFSMPQLEPANTPSAYVRGSDIQVVPDASNIVHNTGNETVAGDKTFTGKLAVSGELDANLTGQVLRLTNPAFSDGWTKVNIATLATDVRKNNGVYALNGQVVEGIGTGIWGYMRITPIGNATAGYVEITITAGVTAITGMDLTNRKLFAYVANAAFNWQYVIDGRGGQRIYGTTTLDSIKSSSVKTGSVTLGDMIINFRQTAVGVNVYMDGSWQGSFSMGDAYVDSGSIPTSISNPRQNVVLNIIGNAGVGGVTANSPFKLEVLITTDGKIKYRSKNLRDNDTASRTATIVGADSTFYALD